MSKHGGTFFAGLLTFLFGVTPPAMAEPIQVNAQFVREDGGPLAGMPVRVVIGSEKAARAPGAGKSMTTDAQGRVRYQVEAPIKQRRIKLDSIFARHDSRLVEVGIELELLGRRALYWIEIDLVKAGPLAGIYVFLPGRGGQFDLPLTFHEKNHSWSLPDQPGGMLLTGTGARLLEHDLQISPSGVWTVTLRMEKQKFTVR
ncbi:MAG: hypothetical protein Q8M07_10145 [Prosthecobacter sp.]|nr:hypothetical protein [Prosthecobacter sp.]